MGIRVEQEEQDTIISTITLIDKHAKRLGVNSKTAVGNLEDFAERVGLIENSGKTIGGNKVSTAKGLYQFIDGSVEPAVNRVRKYIGEKPWMSKVLKSKDANELSRAEQTLLFMGDLLEKKGSDKFMKGVMEGNKEDMLDAYYELHHTKPDMATRKRARDYILK